jgi:UDP-glucuronate 4-epimerase
MKILITGAAGFIGSHLADKLTADGHTVVGIDNFNDYYPPELKRLNQRELAAKGIEVHELDLAKDDLQSSGVLQGAEKIVHLAAQPGISATTSFETYLQNNLIATYRLLEAARQIPELKLFVNIATSSVYGKHASDTEEAAPKPTSYYGVTKLAAEQLALSYQRDKGFPATSLRLFSVFGPRERPDKLYPKLIRAILTDQEFPLFEGSLQHLRSYSYVADIVAGIVLAVNQPEKVIGEVFNIGTDQVTTTAEGIAIVEELLGKKARLQMLPPRPGDQLQTHANIAKARDVLGFAPAHTTREGLTQTVAWFKDKIEKGEI